MQGNIFIRTDGGGLIGLGHLVRCMALAHMLKEDFIICFVCMHIPQTIIDDMYKAGFTVKQIDDESSFFEMLQGSEMVILDHYGLGSDYQMQVKEKGCKLVCIDDFHNQTFYAHLIINHAPGITPQEYDAQPYTSFALGLGYALLRPLFLEAAREPAVIKNIENIFICFGGADPDNLAYRSLTSVSRIAGVKSIAVVAEGNFSATKGLKKLLKDDNRIKIYSGLDERKMCELMQRSGLAIVPSSSVLLESLACGLNIITCYYADNQEDFHNRMVDRGITSVGFADSLYENKLLKAIDEYSPSIGLTYIRQDLRGIKDSHLSKFKSLQYGKI